MAAPTCSRATQKPMGEASSLYSHVASVLLTRTNNLQHSYKWESNQNTQRSQELQRNYGHCQQWLLLIM